MLFRSSVLSAVEGLELAFDLAPLGPLHVQAQLLRGNLSGKLWAQHSATAELIASQLDVLRQRLKHCANWLCRQRQMSASSASPPTPA